MYDFMYSMNNSFLWIGVLPQDALQFLLLAESRWWATARRVQMGSVDYYNRRWYEYTGRKFEDSAGWSWEQQRTF